MVFVLCPVPCAITPLRLIIDAQRKSVNLGELFLELSFQELNSVEVLGEKSTFTSSIDRKTFNIGKDIMTTSGTASELMQHIPSLQVDIEGNVSLRGSGNVLILINGRPLTRPEIKGFELTLKKGESSLEVVFDNSGKAIKKTEAKEEAEKDEKAGKVKN